MSDQRQEVFQRIREALADVRSPRGGAGPEFETFLPPAAGGGKELEDRFTANCEALKTEVVWCANKEEGREKFRALATGSEWKSIASHGASLCQEVLQDWGGDTVWLESGPGTEQLAECGAGVTTCESLLAEPGSVLVSARNCGGRSLSVLPPHHVVVATRDQLLPNLAVALKLLGKRYGDKLPAYLSVISGPSRTADIERVLVLGAHGPKRLTVICY